MEILITTIALVFVVFGALFYHNDKPPLFNPYEEEFRNRRKAKGEKYDLFDE